MTECLFCPNTERLTEEHVIPGSLGCDLVVPDSTCGTCNGDFSLQFEAVVCNQLKPIMHVLSIGNRDGVVPTQDVKFELNGKDFAAHLTADGDMVVRPLAETSIGEDGKEVKHYWFFDEKSRRTAEQRAAKRGEKFVVSPLGDGREILTQPGSQIPLDFIGSEQAKRFAAKIALMAVAYQAGLLTARSAAFAVIRKFISGSSPGNVRLFSNDEFSKATGLSPFHHFIMIWADGQARDVRGIVVLFGGLNYIVELSTTYDGPDLGVTVAYDAYHRKSVQFFVASLENERLGLDLVRDSGSIFDDVPVVAERWGRLVEAGARFVDGIRKERRATAGRK